MPLSDKNIQPRRNRRTLPQPEKQHLWKPTANITPNGERMKGFPQNRNETAVANFTLLVNILREVLVRAISKGREMKDTQIWKEEVKLALLPKAMI